MFRYSRCNRHSVVILALAFVLIQTYVLYSSTFHVFHNSMPMCPVCVAIKNYQNSVVNTVTALLATFQLYLFEEIVPPQVTQFVRPQYQPRAPPIVLAS